MASAGTSVMHTGEQPQNNSGITSATPPITISPPPTSSSKLKLKNICDHHAKTTAEMFFHKLFTDNPPIIPEDITLCNIIEQFCQTFNVILKDLVKTKLIDQETKYPGLLKVTSALPTDKSSDSIVNSSTTKNTRGNSAFIPDGDQTTVSDASRSPMNGNNIETFSSEK